MIIYSYGENTFGSRAYLRSLVGEFKKQRDPGGYNVVVLDGKKTELSKVLAEISTAPFLAEKKLVVLENPLSSSDKELLAGLIDRVKSGGVPESTILVVWQGEKHSKIKEAKELDELLAQEKYSKEHPVLSGPALAEWIRQRVAEKGTSIEKNAVEKLAERGSDAWSLASAVNQLAAFALGRAISVKDVEEFSEEKPDENIFNLTDAVVAGDHKRALKLLENQRQAGEDDGKLFGTILWQFRILVEMSDLLEREGNLTSDQIAKKLGVHPFVAKKNLATVRQYSQARLASVYARLLETDIKTKTGRGDQSLLLDLFVAKI